MGKAVEWSLNMMTTGAMKLRELERTAKQNKKGIWLNYVPQVSNSATGPLFPAVGEQCLNVRLAYIGRAA
jgi:staphylococcal nuclease domain-containing protein 1